MTLSEQQWLTLIIGACTIIGVCIGYVLRHLEQVAQKRREFDARRWHETRRLVLMKPEVSPEPPTAA